MPNRKTDTNHLDFFGASFGYPEGSYEERERMEKEHRDYAVGMLWFLANDPRVPEEMRTEMGRWGFPADEFEDNGHFPYQIYVREARRMVSDFVMTEKNVVKEDRVPVDRPVGMGSYALDCHYVSRVVDNDGLLRNEGTIFWPTVPYQIDYGAIVLLPMWPTARYEWNLTTWCSGSLQPRQPHSPWMKDVLSRMWTIIS